MTNEKTALVLFWGTILFVVIMGIVYMQIAWDNNFDKHIHPLPTHTDIAR